MYTNVWQSGNYYCSGDTYVLIKMYVHTNKMYVHVESMYFYYRTGMHGLMKPTPAKSLRIVFNGPPV